MKNIRHENIFIFAHSFITGSASFSLEPVWKSLYYYCSRTEVIYADFATCCTSNSFSERREEGFSIPILLVILLL